MQLGVLPEAEKTELAATYDGLNPVKLLKQINDKKALIQIKARALAGIGYIGGKDCIEPLVQYYKKEKNATMRAEAIFALGFIMDRQEIGSLYKITADNNFNIRLLIMDHIFVSRPD